MYWEITHIQRHQFKKCDFKFQREERIIVLYMVLGVEVGIGVDKNNSCVHMTVQTGEMKSSQSVLRKHTECTLRGN